MSEHDEQAAVINWAFDNMAEYPELDLLHAIPNGAMLGGGRIGAMRMNYLKAEGLRPGVCDLFLPVARGGYFGLYIEMKTDTGTLSENQKEFIRAVQEQGFMALTARGRWVAIEALEKYMKQKPTKRYNERK